MVAYARCRGAGRDAGHRRGPFPLPVAGPPLAQGRDERQRRCACVDLELDCDGDALLLHGRADGPTCHRGTRSCFDPETAAGPGADAARRHAHRASTGSRPCGRRSRTAWRPDRPAPTRPASSTAGSMRSRRKVTEEATEVLLAAKDDAAAEAGRRGSRRDARGAGRRGGRPALSRARAAGRARPPAVGGRRRPARPPLRLRPGSALSSSRLRGEAQAGSTRRPDTSSSRCAGSGSARRSGPGPGRRRRPARCSLIETPPWLSCAPGLAGRAEQTRPRRSPRSVRPRRPRVG